MNNQRRFIQGTPALLLCLGVGGASLAITGHRLAQLDPSGGGTLFVVGLASGYLAPLTFRIARMIGPDRMARLGWLRMGLLILFFLALLTPFIAAVIMPLQVAQVLRFVGGGTLAMAVLGTGLQDDGVPKAAA